MMVAWHSKADVVVVHSQIIIAHSNRPDQGRTAVAAEQRELIAASGQAGQSESHQRAAVVSLPASTVATDLPAKLPAAGS